MFLLLLFGMTALRSFKRTPGSLLLLLLMVLLQNLDVGGQIIEITQLPKTVSVRAGENLTLTCTLSGPNLPGPVRWYKVLGNGNVVVVKDVEVVSSPHVKVIRWSNTHLTLNFQNIHPEDAGPYNCIKFSAGFPEEQLASGKGTKVFVITKPSQPVVGGPTGRITAGSQASFNCSAEGFFPREITVSWLKDGKEIQTAQTDIVDSERKETISYRVDSMAKIPLEQGDVKSQLSCQIQHSSLEAPLQQTFPLGDVLRVPPKVHLATSPPSPVWVNASVMVICNVDSFYPDVATVELFAMDVPSRKGMVGSTTLNPDGTFSLKSYLEVMATEDKNYSQFNCVLQENSQSLVNETMTLVITQQLAGSSPQHSIFVLCVSLFLSKVAVLLSISSFFLMKRCGCKRAKNCSGTFQEVRQFGTSS